MNLEECDAEFDSIALSRDSEAIRRSFLRLLEDHPILTSVLDAEVFIGAQD
jgi:hypothetical protein